MKPRFKGIKECIECHDFDPQYVNSSGYPICKQCVEIEEDYHSNVLLDTNYHCKTSGYNDRFNADKGKFKPMSLSTYNKYEWDYYDSSEQPIGIGEWGIVLDDNGSTPLYMIICDDGDYVVIDMYLVRKRLVELEGESHYLPDWLKEVKESEE